MSDKPQEYETNVFGFRLPVGETSTGWVAFCSTGSFTFFAVLCFILHLFTHGFWSTAFLVAAVILGVFAVLCLITWLVCLIRFVFW